MILRFHCDHPDVDGPPVGRILGLGRGGVLNPYGKRTYGCRRSEVEDAARSSGLLGQPRPGRRPRPANPLSRIRRYWGRFRRLPAVLETRAGLRAGAPRDAPHRARCHERHVGVTTYHSGAESVHTVLRGFPFSGRGNADYRVVSFAVGVRTGLQTAETASHGRWLSSRPSSPC